MTFGLPYLVLIRGDSAVVGCYGPVTAMNAESAAQKELSHMAEMDFTGVGIEVYPVGVTLDGDVECEKIAPEVLGE